jgi:hypothetical protein
MRSIKTESAELHLLKSDKSNYLWLVRFFTGYHYLSQKMDLPKKAVCITTIVGKKRF